MSKRNKLFKFSKILEFSNVVENFDPSDSLLTTSLGQKKDLKGIWAKDFFENSAPITLELACGRGEYTLALARNFPERNFLGVDIKGARIFQGARIALEENLKNAGFLRTRIELIEGFFDPGEVEEIWITFPDPFLKSKKENRRLTSLPFLRRYKKLLKPNGLIHLKTDSDELFEFTEKTLRENPELVVIEEINRDIYAGPLPIPELAFKTYYEKMHLEAGKKIKYVRFRLL
ncbi:MAG: tRNA (guanosine(46)-N7)-methyltransferase TrmB [Saprospiraceae bacterium]|nr:tRNA (guanosine(46)-N7)-methyltransferase TrmB [Saprospiraceae bacterium]